MADKEEVIKTKGATKTGYGGLKLTHNEKRDIIALLEANKPLPDKYRFLLFDEKREVELVWNGKTNEVCNIVLPFQTIEHVDEPRIEKPSDPPPMYKRVCLMSEADNSRVGLTNSSGVITN